MVARKCEELIAWQLSEAFRAEIYSLVRGSPEANDDLRYRRQIFDAADGIGVNIREGFLRFSPGEFCKFLDYALASLGEAEQRLKNGVRRTYFDEPSCREALQLARRALTAIVRIKQSQKRRAEQQKQKGKRS
jgi:four helix bundle protein